MVMLSLATGDVGEFRTLCKTTRPVTPCFGPKLEYVDRGNLRGVPVILLHGYTDSWLSYATVLPHLAPRIRAIAISQRGHGESDRPYAGYRSRDFAADLNGFLDAVDIGRAVVVGHSMGSHVALRFALAHPERVLGLGLLGGFATLADNPIIRELNDAVATLRDPVDVDFIRTFHDSAASRGRVPRHRRPGEPESAGAHLARGAGRANQ